MRVSDRVAGPLVASGDVQVAKVGVIPSFMQPLDHPIPMVATADVGQVAADLLRESWTGLSIIELEGPRRYSANDIAAGFAEALRPPVRTTSARDTWEVPFRSQGLSNSR
jgi:NAD(P)H dehydrogenase (quinone)